MADTKELTVQYPVEQKVVAADLYCKNTPLTEISEKTGIMIPVLTHWIATEKWEQLRIQLSRDGERVNSEKLREFILTEQLPVAKQMHATALLLLENIEFKLSQKHRNGKVRRLEVNELTKLATMLKNVAGVVMPVMRLSDTEGNATKPAKQVITMKLIPQAIESGPTVPAPAALPAAVDVEICDEPDDPF